MHAFVIVFVVDANKYIDWLIIMNHICKLAHYDICTWMCKYVSCINLHLCIQVINFAVLDFAWHMFRVSSVLNRDNKQFGKSHMFDGKEDTCWNSDEVCIVSVYQIMPVCYTTMNNSVTKLLQFSWCNKYCKIALQDKIYSVNSAYHF